MVQPIRALTALPEVLSTIPSNHTMAHNHLSWDLMTSSGMSDSETTHTGVLVLGEKKPIHPESGFFLDEQDGGRVRRTFDVRELELH